MNILVLNGPNLNWLGKREPEIYGNESLDELMAQVDKYAAVSGASCLFAQSNHEGELIDLLQDADTDPDCAGVVLNPGAYAHYSYALRDAVASLQLPTVEVHLTDVHAREDFRKNLVISPACVATIVGKGVQGYMEAVDIILDQAGRQ